jgi:hypothetical protein
MTLRKYYQVSVAVVEARLTLIVITCLIVRISAPLIPTKISLAYVAVGFQTLIVIRMVLLTALIDALGL